MIEIKGVTKQFKNETAIDYRDITFEDGRSYMLLGASGCGKSTLLNMIAGILSPERGEIVIDGRVMSSLPQREKDKFRIEKIGYIFQDFKLIPDMTVTDNINILRLEGVDTSRAPELMRRLGILEQQKKKVKHLSGGQKQRVAVASAIASERPLILFDEPTSGLDLFHMRQVANVVNQVANAGRTALVVTHDPEFILRCCNYVLHLENGQIQESYSIEDSDGRKRLLKFFLSDMKKEVSTE